LKATIVPENKETNVKRAWTNVQTEMYPPITKMFLTDYKVGNKLYPGATSLESMTCEASTQ